MPMISIWMGMYTLSVHRSRKKYRTSLYPLFYNADTQKLGIPVEKQSYTEYYFPYANSYIIYEVATENGAFCILSFKSMNRVSYRFIDSPYRKEFFIDPETRIAYTSRPGTYAARFAERRLLTYYLHFR